MGKHLPPERCLVCKEMMLLEVKGSNSFLLPGAINISSVEDKQAVQAKQSVA
jgi:hypothetical protein